MKDQSAQWISLHVFLSDSARCLQFINEWLSRETRRLQTQGQLQAWFFIRYWEGGPHLRLRFKLTDPAYADQLLADLQQATQNYLNPEPISRETYYGAHAFDGQALDTSTLSWYEEGTVAAIDYQPEWVRYGGADAMAVSEQLFQVSSEIALALAGKTERTLESHMTSALGLMFASARALSAAIPAAENFFDQYAAFWRDYNDDAKLAERQAMQQPVAPVRARIAALSDQLQAESSAATPERIWWQAVRRALVQWRVIFERGALISPLSGAVVATDADFRVAVQLIVSSQIHMMNNRLGVIPAQECYLARLLAGAAQAVAA